MQLESVHVKLVEHDHRFDEHDRRFDTIDRRFEAVDQRFDAIDQRFDEHDRLFDEMRQEFHEFRILQEEQAVKLDKVLDVVLHMNERLARHDELAARVDRHDHRITALEATVGLRPLDPRSV